MRGVINPEMLHGDREQINSMLKELSKMVLPEHLSLFVANISELIEQDVNPRSMTKKTFDQLVDNISTVGGLESVPLCVRTDKGIEIVSGNHRVRAGRAAGVKVVLVLLYEDLSKSAMYSKQLSHNTIAGSDDPELVARVFGAITDVAEQFAAYVDPRIIDLIPDPVKFNPPDVNLLGNSRVVLLMFLSSQHDDFVAAAEAIVPSVDVDRMYMANRDFYDSWRKALQTVRDECEIFSIPTAVVEMARLAMERLAQIRLEKGELEEHDVDEPMREPLALPT